jgi:hypothetical protein
LIDISNKIKYKYLLFADFSSFMLIDLVYGKFMGSQRKLLDLYEKIVIDI